jgi:hypothetical protein
MRSDATDERTDRTYERFRVEAHDQELQGWIRPIGRSKRLSQMEAMIWAKVQLKQFFAQGFLSPNSRLDQTI